MIPQKLIPLNLRGGAAFTTYHMCYPGGMQKFWKIVIILLLLSIPLWLSIHVNEANAAQDLKLFGVPASYKVFLNEAPQNYWAENKINIRAAKNEYESFQLVLRNNTNQQIDAVKIRPGSLDSTNGQGYIAADNIKPYRVEYVTLTDTRNDPNNLLPPPDLPIPGNFPDPLWPLDQSENTTTVMPQQNQAFWITVFIPPTTAAGNYQGTVEVLLPNGENRQLTVNLSVFNFTLPDKSSLKSMFNLGDYYDRYAPLGLRAYHGVVPPDDYPGPLSRKQKANLAQIVDKYYQSFKSSRISPFLYSQAFRAIDWSLPRYGLDQSTDSVWVDFSRFDPLADKYLTDSSFSTFTVPNVGINLFGDCIVECDGHSPTDQEKQRWRQHAEDYFGELASHLEEKGLLEKAVLYLADEIKPDQVKFVQEVSLAAEKAAPDLTRAVSFTENSVDSQGRYPSEYLVGAADIWIPEVRTLDELDSLEDTKWIYEFTTQRIDLSGITNRLFPWMAWHYNAKGILYYATNYWPVDRWSSPRLTNEKVPWVDRYGTVNGNGFYFYQPCRSGKDTTRDLEFQLPSGNETITHEVCQEFTDRIVPSIRWELLREGMEDYEYFKLLEKRAVDDPQAQELLTSAKNIISEAHNFEKDTQKYLDLRKQIARRIEENSCTGADLNCDNTTNILDLLHWRREVATRETKECNLLDYLQVLRGWFST